jgi:predicted nuclease of predicted toxin-antitoxin system
MATAVKLDEALSPLVAQPLADQGYDVRTVRGQGWAGLKDEQLWPLVQNEQVFFITLDKGFGDIRTRAPGTHAGVLVLRPDDERLHEFRALLESVLAHHTVESLSGCVAVATPRGLRVRRPTSP